MEDLLPQLRQLGEAHTFIGIFATTCVVGWHLYRLPLLQARIPARVRWESFTPLQQWTFTAVASAVAGALTALSTGKSGWEIVRAVLSAVQSAILVPGK
jgi:hypothetical protein